MRDEDAEEAAAVLRALGGPLLRWESVLPEVGAVATVLDAAGEVRCRFELFASRGRDLGADEAGVAYHWFLGVVVRGQRDAHWGFPCRTDEEAKAICERVVGTGRTAEINRRGRLRYPLVWEWDEASGSDCRVAHVCKTYRVWGTDMDTVRYVVAWKRFWVIGWFRAEYKVPLLTKKTDWHVNYHTLRPRSRSSRRYRTEAEAQAACCRHHWTGNWE